MSFALERLGDLLIQEASFLQWVKGKAVEIQVMRMQERLLMMLKMS